jgi:DNA-binding FadR family transcriptional regulator
LLLVTRLLRSVYQESARLTRRRPENYLQLLADHEAILQAIRDRDPGTAAVLSKEHMQHGLKIAFPGDRASARKVPRTKKAKVSVTNDE